MLSLRSLFRLLCLMIFVAVSSLPAFAQPARRNPSVTSGQVKSGTSGRPKSGLALLVHDMSEISPSTEPSAENVEKLQKDLLEIVTTPVKPSPEVLKPLADSLNKALARREKVNCHEKELATNLSTILNKNALYPERVEHALKESSAILKVAGAPDEDLKAFQESLKVVSQRSLRPAMTPPNAYYGR